MAVGKGNIWVWVGLLWTDRVRAVLDQYGDRINDVSIFGWTVDTDGSLTQTFNPAQLDPYRAKWPHIRFWACFRNMEAPSGATSRQVFDSLRFNASARSRLSTDLSNVFDQHPWLHGVDIDLEGGGNDHQVESETVFRQVANTARAKGKQVSAALPALTATGSVGGENWVRYKQLGQILDRVSTMSYDLAWNGSAPGPISPGFWMQDVYDWATSQIPPSKLSMGVPAYARTWRIDDEPTGPYRGESTNYYGMRNYLDGVWTDAQGSAPLQPAVPWLAYRDTSDMVPWAFLGVYDWLPPLGRAASKGVVFATFEGRQYGTRRGKAAGTPLWTLADQSLRGEYADYVLRPRKVRDVTGKWVEPRSGYNLTVELLRRRAESVVIFDDDARNTDQLATSLYATSGSWSQWYSEQNPGNRAEYGQYRVTSAGGTLQFNRNFGTQALHMVARAQMPASGSRWGVTVGDIRVDVNASGVVRILEGGTVRASATVGGLYGPSSEPGQHRTVLGVRVRGGKVRAYASASLNAVPLRLEANVSATAGHGRAGVWADGRAWFDYLRLGDGWWFTPREAVQVVAGNRSWTLGRDSRTGVTWDRVRNRFRPNSDVEESETLTLPTSLDWDYYHIKNFPAPTGKNTRIKVRPLDVDVWQGRLLLCDREGAQLGFYADAEYLAYWADRAKFDYGLQGVAIWTLGQEDIRFWERIKGGDQTREITF